MSTRTFGVGKRQVTLDLTHQCLSLELHDLPLPHHAIEPVPSPATTGLVSCAALAHKAKQFDEGLRAAIERLLQRGAGPTPGRRLLLALLADKLSKTKSLPRGDAVAAVFAACKLGAIEVSVPARHQEDVDNLLEDFALDPLRSLPLGLYGEHPDLARSFWQDRMLATRLQDAQALRAVAKGLHSDPKLAAMYRAHVSLNRRLAGAFKRKSLRHVIAHFEGRTDLSIAPEASFFPPSDSVEDRLIRPLEGRNHVLRMLLRRVKTGRIKLKLPAIPSWRDHQVWSLEGIARLAAMPEAKQLSLGPVYESHLDALFIAMLTLVRETHLKDLEPEEEECEEEEAENGTVVVQPGLSVEPLPTNYDRVAAGYGFVRSLLEERFGRALAETARVGRGATKGVSLGDELVAMEALFRDAAETARDALGMTMERPRAGQTAFSKWSAARSRDPDMGADARTMVPLSKTIEGDFRVMLVLGWRPRTLEVGYARRPRVVESHRQVVFEGETHTVESPVVVEAVVRDVMGRDDFRRLCDRHRSVGAILRALR